MLLQLLIAFLSFLPAIYLFFRGQNKQGLWLLLGASFLLRLIVVNFDPFLHDWDERFHAVVAKNMMQYPFRPMIRLEALLPYKIEDWCCNYVWVHKQPLFLWQMAGSMKIFGVNIFALRLPNVIMGTFMVYFIYQIARIWTQKDLIAFISACLLATNYYNLELSAGSMSLDHNDVMMGGYVLASIWAFSRYTTATNKPIKWIILTGLFVGCAVLNKWLTGLLVFGGWGLYLLVDRTRLLNIKNWLHFFGAVGVALVVFLPWQWYIRTAFPAESAVAYAHNIEHIFKDLGHPGDYLTHIRFMTTAYSHKILLGLMLLGTVFSMIQNSFNRSLSIAMAAMFAVVYLFFSVVVKTKMPGLTFPVAGIGYIWIATGCYAVIHYVNNAVVFNRDVVKMGFGFVALLGILIINLNPAKILYERRADNEVRNAEIHNTEIYQKLHQFVSPDDIIINCKSFEDTEVRFWQPNNAYHWWPTESQVDSLVKMGYKLSAFDNHNDQILPEYIKKNKSTNIVDLKLR